MKLNTLQCFHSVKRKPHCGLDGLASFSLAYTDRDNGHLVLMTYIPKQDGDLICIGPKKCSTDTSCNSWSEARLSTHIVRNPGQWQSLPSGAVVGVRKRSATQHTSHSPISVVSSLRRRTKNTSPPRSTSSIRYKPQEADVWEAWMISAKGERHTIPLYQEGDMQPGGHQLWVTACGPMTRVGRRSVALGFGNVIKVITVGHEWWDGTEDVAEDFAVKMGREKKRKHAKHHGVHDKHGTSTPKTGGCCTMEAFGGGSGMPTPVKEKTGFSFEAGPGACSGSGSATPTPHIMARQPPLPLPMRVENLTLPMKGRRVSQANGHATPGAVTAPATGGSCCGTQSPVQSPVNDGFVMVNAPANGFPNGMVAAAAMNAMSGSGETRSCAA